MSRLRAEIHGPTAIRATLTGATRPLDPAEWRLTDGRGRPLALSAVIPATATVSLLVPESPLDPLRVHRLALPSLELRCLVRRDPFFRNLYSGRPMGARVAADGAETAFAVFSPRATAVQVHLYGADGGGAATAEWVMEMDRDAHGVWEARVEGDLHGTWYDFTVHGPDDPGDFFFGAHPVHVSDPWALVHDDGTGRSRVWRDGPPPPPLAGGRPPMEDVVAYEVHVQDFTDLLPVDPAEAGTLPGMVRPGLVNAHGEPVGFDHLVSLGVNVVHLMPVQEAYHHPDLAWRDAFAHDPFAQAMAIGDENYQWGYRTTHAFAVEGRYRRRGTEPGAERQAFRDLVAAFHARGIAVVIDVVPNHTGEDVDGRHRLLHFNVLDRPYWYRTDDELGHIGPFGNEVKSEDRPMVQRWIVEQLRHWVDALGVDGFRIDLAGQIDRQTLLRVKAELPDDLIVYGEPWIPPSDPDVRAHPDWAWYKADAPITFFQDETRNAYQGSPFDVDERGWAGGDPGARDATVRALANRYAEEPRTTAGIAYLDIHDNWALADRYALHDRNGLLGVDVAAVRRAAGLLLTTAGPVVIHGGSEMLRSKGLAPEEAFEKETPFATLHFKGRADTYNLRAPNRFLWDSLSPGSGAAEMRDWWRGLLALRRSGAGAVFRVAEPGPDHYRFVLPDDGHLLGYVVGGRIAVAANNGSGDGTLELDLPAGRWRQVADGVRCDPAGVAPGRPLQGGRRSIGVPAGAFLVWVRE